MLTLDLADSLTVSAAAATTVDGVRTVRWRTVRRTRRTSSFALSMPSGGRQRFISTSRFPMAAGSAAVRPTPRRSCAGRASTIPPSPPALGADVPFCLVGGRARVTGIGEVVEPLAARRAHRDLGRAPAARQHAGRLPRLGRTRRPDGGRSQRPRAGGDRRRAATRRVARPHRRAERERPRCSPAAAQRGSSRADATTPSAH